MDVTSGEFGEENERLVYFHLDDGQTFFATIGAEGENMMGFLDMKAEAEDEPTQG